MKNLCLIIAISMIIVSCGKNDDSESTMQELLLKGLLPVLTKKYRIQIG